MIDLVYIYKIIITGLLTFSAHNFEPTKRPDVRGVSTIFGTTGDRHMGGDLACLPGRYATKTYVCAHRTLPCGTLLILENPVNKKRTWCQVMDRGPYGALDEDGNWFVKKTVDEPGEWRGVLDVAPIPAKAIGHNGYQYIRAWVAPGFSPKKQLLRDTPSSLIDGLKNIQYMHWLYTKGYKNLN